MRYVFLSTVCQKLLASLLFEIRSADIYEIEELTAIKFSSIFLDEVFLEKAVSLKARITCGVPLNEL